MPRIFVLLMSLCVAGCATINMAEAPPRAKQTTDVHVLTSAKSNPASTIIYQVPESSTFIAVRVNVSRSAADVVGGLVGLAIAAGQFSDAIDWTRDAIKGNERNLTVNMAELASSILGAKIKELAAGNELRIGTDASAKGTPSLSLLPYVVLGYISDSELRPFVFVDAVLKDESGSEIWQTRYIGSTKEDRTLTGDNGWSSSSGKLLREAVARATEHALDTAVRDLAGKLPRASATDALLKTQWPVSVFNTRDWRGRLIESNDRTIVFIPEFGGILAGVYSIPKELAEIRTPPR